MALLRKSQRKRYSFLLFSALHERLPPKSKASGFALSCRRDPGQGTGSCRHPAAARRAGSRLIRRHVNRKPKRPGRASRRRGEGGRRGCITRPTRHLGATSPPQGRGVWRREPVPLIPWMPAGVRGQKHPGAHVQAGAGTRGPHTRATHADTDTLRAAKRSSPVQPPAPRFPTTRVKGRGLISGARA